MDELSRKIQQLGVVPVLVIDKAIDAAPIGKALVAGGLPVAEVTMRTDAACEAIGIMKQIPGLAVGAGTVLSSAQAAQAIAAGASFIVSPGLDEGVVSTARQNGVPVYPGTATASEIQRAWNLGLRTVKFFPAGIAGGVKAIKALSSVFRDMSFMPTGGVSLENLKDYLELRSVCAVGGSWIAPSDLISEGRFEDISGRAAEAVATARRIRGES